MYWNLLKKTFGVRTINVLLSTLEQYLKAVNDRSSPFYFPDEDIIYFNTRYENEKFDIMLKNESSEECI